MRFLQYFGQLEHGENQVRVALLILSIVHFQKEVAQHGDYYNPRTQTISTMHQGLIVLDDED